jgi:nucleoside-triphosphatase THEP1
MDRAKNGLLWRKAAVLGSLWAASEIVLGSFLHNARVPFAGEFLTCIGIALLAAGRRLWPERGLLWRAGLVCASMKAVSPSAVIFGPMIAIAAEGLLMEAGTALPIGAVAGSLLGGGLAMSWALVQKIGNMLLFYGADTVALYSRGLEKLRAFAGLGQGGIYGPLLALLGVYFAAGMLAAALGLKAGAGEKAGARPVIPSAAAPRAAAHGEYSIPALAANMAFLITVLAAGKSLSAARLAAVAAVYGGLCAAFYPRARALLGRPGVWGGVLAVSLLAGLVLGAPLAGVYMALRAFVLTLGFAAVGEELLNPRIRAWLERFLGGTFFETLEFAFASLPGVLAAFPSGRELAGRPVASLRAVVAMAPAWLESLAGRRVFLITGGHGAGKSSLAAQLAAGLRQAGKRPGGIISEGLWKEGQRDGFDLVDLSCGTRTPLCRRAATWGAVSTGRFNFYDEGLAAGLKALSPETLAGADAVFVDEAGWLELEGKGWAPAFAGLRGLKAPLVIVVRDYLTAQVSAALRLSSPVVWEAGKTAAAAALAELSGAIENSRRLA